jgi:hypothetical protein
VISTRKKLLFHWRPTTGYFNLERKMDQQEEAEEAEGAEEERLARIVGFTCEG